jgi:hypothetical protein
MKTLRPAYCLIIGFCIPVLIMVVVLIIRMFV